MLWGLISNVRTINVFVVFCTLMTRSLTHHGTLSALSWGLLENNFLICKVADLEMWMSFVMTKQNYLSSVKTGKLVELCVVVHLWHSRPLHFLSQYWSSCKETSLTHPGGRQTAESFGSPVRMGYKKTEKCLSFVFICLPKTSRCFLPCSFSWHLP